MVPVLLFQRQQKKTYMIKKVGFEYETEKEEIGMK